MPPGLDQDWRHHLDSASEVECFLVFQRGSFADQLVFHQWEHVPKRPIPSFLALEQKYLAGVSTVAIISPTHGTETHDPSVAHTGGIIPAAIYRSQADDHLNPAPVNSIYTARRLCTPAFYGVSKGILRRRTSSSSSGARAIRPSLSFLTVEQKHLGDTSTMAIISPHLSLSRTPHIDPKAAASVWFRSRCRWLMRLRWYASSIAPQWHTAAWRHSGTE